MGANNLLESHCGLSLTSNGLACVTVSPPNHKPPRQNYLRACVCVWGGGGGGEGLIINEKADCTQKYIKKICFEFMLMRKLSG